MRDVSEMTEAELCSLDALEIEDAYRVRYLRDGVPLTLPIVPDAPVAPKIEPDVVGYETCGINFVDREAAEQVAQLASRFPVLMFEYHYDSSELLHYTANGTKLEQHDVTTKRYISAKRKAEYADVVARFDAANALYRKAVEGLSAVQRLQDAAKRDVDAVISEARSAEIARNHWTSEIENYIRLSSGDGEIARRFFEKAHPSILEGHPELVSCFETPPKETPRPPR